MIVTADPRCRTGTPRFVPFTLQRECLFAIFCLPECASDFMRGNTAKAVIFGLINLISCGHSVARFPSIKCNKKVILHPKTPKNAKTQAKDQSDMVARTQQEGFEGAEQVCDHGLHAPDLLIHRQLVEMVLVLGDSFKPQLKGRRWLPSFSAHRCYCHVFNRIWSPFT